LSIARAQLPRKTSGKTITLRNGGGRVTVAEPRSGVRVACGGVPEVGIADVGVARGGVDSGVMDGGGEVDVRAAVGVGVGPVPGLGLGPGLGTPLVVGVAVGAGGVPEAGVAVAAVGFGVEFSVGFGVALAGGSTSIHGTGKANAAGPVSPVNVAVMAASA
jgi:hypothetical protein